MYIKKGSESNMLENIRGINSPTEIVWEEILGTVDYLKVGMYNHPLHQTPEGGLEMEKKIREAIKADNITILGGFNYTNIDWVNMRSSHAIEMGFLDIINDSELE